MDLRFGNLEYESGNGVTYRGGFVSCPKCGADAELRIWGEGIDATFNCVNDDCDITSESIR